MRRFTADREHVAYHVGLDYVLAAFADKGIDYCFSEEELPCGILVQYGSDKYDPIGIEIYNYSEKFSGFPETFKLETAHGSFEVHLSGCTEYGKVAQAV